MHVPPKSNMQSSANQARFQKNFSRPLAVGTTMSLKRSRGWVCCGESVMCFSSLESADPKIKLSRGLRWFPLAFSVHFWPGKYLRGYEPAAAGGPWPRDATCRVVSRLATGSGRWAKPREIARRGPTWR